MQKRGLNAGGKQLSLIGRLRKATDADGTFIGVNTAPVRMTFEPFNRLPPPLVPQPTVHEVDLEPGSGNFARSVDPVESVTENANKTADSILNTDHSSRPVIENNVNPELEATNL